MSSDGVDHGVKSKKKAHVLVVTISFPGNFAPAVQILYHLATKYPGLTVTVMGNKDRIADLAKLQSKGDFKSLDLRLEEVFGPIPVFHEDPKFPVRTINIVDNNYMECESFRKKLIAQKDAPGAPTSIVSDMFQIWSQDLAGELGVPWYTYYACSPILSVTMLETPKLIKAGVYPYTSTNISEILTTAVPSLAYAPGLSSVRVGDIPEERFLFPEFSTKIAESAIRATAVVINASEEIDSQVGAIIGMRSLVKSSRVLPIGPLVRLPGFGFTYNSTDFTTNCLDWLQGQRPKSVLYIAFGTLAMIPKEWSMELAKGLEASGVPFLWVLKLGSCKLSELVPPGFVERTKGRGFIETGWAPQSSILAHASTGGFLTHCGWNSMMESMCSGVPFIAWPVSADQPMNARFIADIAKVGFALSYFKSENKDSFADISREEVEKAVRSLMLGEEGVQVRKNVAGMQKILAASVAEGGSSYQNLRTFLDEIAII